MQIIYVNGTFVYPNAARLSPMDRGLQLGDGAFETLRSYQGHLFAFNEHWQRLQHGLKILKLDSGYSRLDAKRIINNLLVQNDLFEEDVAVRITVTRGASQRGINIPSSAKPTLVITTNPLDACISDPISAFIVSIRANEHSPLCQFKSLNYLDKILARESAIENGADEALLINSQGNLVGASAANFFMFKENTLFTPSLKCGALPGVTRNTVIRIARQHGIKVVEDKIKPEAILSAEEAFITNSLIELQPISQINDTKFPTSSSISMQKWLKEKLTGLIDSYSDYTHPVN